MMRYEAALLLEDDTPSSLRLCAPTFNEQEAARVALAMANAHKRDTAVVVCSTDKIVQRIRYQPRTVETSSPQPEGTISLRTFAALLHLHSPSLPVSVHESYDGTSTVYVLYLPKPKDDTMPEHQGSKRVGPPQKGFLLPAGFYWIVGGIIYMTTAFWTWAALHAPPQTERWF